MRRYKWSEEEDNLVNALVQKAVPNVDWELIHIQFIQQGFAKTAKQIKLRWNNTLSPNLNKKKWSKTQQMKLFKCYSKYGNHWKMIATSFKGRTDNGVKNQFFSVIRKALRISLKLIDAQKDTCYTKTINSIRPRVLTDFITICSEVQFVDELKDLKIMDFIKRYTFTPLAQLKQTVDDEEKIVIRSVIDKLTTMNELYIGKKDKSKKIRKFLNGESFEVPTERSKENHVDYTKPEKESKNLLLSVSSINCEYEPAMKDSKNLINQINFHSPRVESCFPSPKNLSIHFNFNEPENTNLNDSANQTIKQAINSDLRQRSQFNLIKLRTLDEFEQEKAEFNMMLDSVGRRTPRELFKPKHSRFKCFSPKIIPNKRQLHINTAFRFDNKETFSLLGSPMRKYHDFIGRQSEFESDRPN